MDHYLQQQRNEVFERLGKMLGVFWTLDDVRAMIDPTKEPGQGKQTEFFYPLSCLIEPRLPEILKKTVGSQYGIDAPKWARQGSLEDMFDWGAEQFLKFVGGVVEKKASTGNRAL